MKIFKFTKTITWIAVKELEIVAILNCPGRISKCHGCSWNTKGLCHYVFEYENN